MTAKNGLEPEQRLFLLYLIEQKKSACQIKEEFSKRYSINVDKEFKSITAGRRKDTGLISIIDASARENVDIFVLTKQAFSRGLVIDSEFLTTESLEIIMGREKEVIMPISDSSLKNFMNMNIVDLTPSMWKKIRYRYQQTYGDLDLPEFSYLRCLEKRRSNPKPKRMIPHAGLLAKEIYSGYSRGDSIKRLHKRLGLSIPTVVQFLRRSGVLDDEFIRDELSTLEDITTKSILGFKIYSGENKQGIREKELAIAAGFFGKRKIRYLGLEGSNFISYIQFAKGLNIEPCRSLVPEREEFKSNIMKSIVKYNHIINNGEIFKDLNVYSGEVAGALEKFAIPNSLRFNLVNLDYEGGFTKEKEETIDLLLGVLDKRSLIFITLNDTAMWRTRLVSEGLKGYDFSTTSQARIMEGILDRSTLHHRSVLNEAYGDTKHRMLAVGYYIEK
jgi:hypothetical protein